MSDMENDAAMADRASPGWYQIDNQNQRYWDGANWTGHVSPIHGGPPAPQAQSAIDDNTYALLLHLSSFIFPLVGPLVMWLIKRQTSPFIDHHGKQALNFQITMFIAGVVSAILVLILIGFLLLLALGVAQIVLTVMAAVAASRGEYYKYPLTIPFIR